MNVQEKYDYINHMFEELAIHGDGITEWEEDFLKSIRQQFKMKESLSPRQLEILERIHSERT